MLPEQWQKLEEIFQNAADLAPDSQTVYLDQACRGDLELRQEVEALLAASPLGLIESAIAATADDFTEPESDPLVGTWLGPYRIDGLIGRGGMGAVYRAFREDDQFHKQVAIKVIPRMLAGPDVVARFRSERQILANLEHQNIARLLDGGTTEGIPYLVMEYVEGVPITQYVQAKALPLADRLRLMQSVCSAVLYAHHSLVIHRDLKPAKYSQGSALIASRVRTARCGASGLQLPNCNVIQVWQEPVCAGPYLGETPKTGRTSNRWRHPR